jgi:hypothetical protein
MKRRPMRDLDPSNLFKVVICFDCVDVFNPHDSPVRLISDGLKPWNRAIVQKIEQTVKVIRRPVRQSNRERTRATIHLHCPVVKS